MRHIALLVALSVMALAALAYQPRPTYACSCTPPPPPLQARDSATAVFAGTVSGIAPADPGRASVLVTFDVQQIWKGPEGAQLTIATAGSSASCGYEFAQGEQYLVYAVAQEGQIRTSLCSRTALFASAGEDLAALGTGTPVAPAAGPITSDEMGIPWLPLVVGGIGLAIVLAVGVSWLRRR
ncbi:MAG: hypothetical protein HGA45_22460 [Chloroflexales bacterium]|nr:hypothetical protein [Chloroflexales bacterium]